jgi:O-antigen ligase
MPLSVAPTATWLSFLSLLAPLAIFLGTIQLRLRERRRLTLIVIAVAVVSAFLGLVQFGQGPGSSLRFFAVTNINDAVGFFANRNHFAALLYTSLLFAAAWAIDFAFKNASWDNLKRFTPVTVVALTASFLVVIVLLAAEGMARSRAGIILSIVALAGIFALASTDRRNTGGLAGAGVGKLLFAAIGLALLLVVEFGLYRIANRFSDPLEGARTVFAHNTIRAALAFMPFGAGLGTFVPVYAMFERPVDTLANVYANHAHDDVLEWWLETGVVGIAMMAFFVFGLVTISLKIWRHPPDQASNLDCLLMRAATIVVGLLIAHSIVDYPLRTDAMMAVFALSCAMMIEPLSGQEAADLRLDDVHGAVRRKNQFREPSSKPPIRPIPSQGPPQPAFPTTQARKRWGEDVDWPEEWRDRTERSAAVGDASAVDTPSDSEE